MRPVSPYGVTKLPAENLLGAYHEIYGLPVTVVRFFSVYGPRQRPDMAWHKFIAAIAADEAISIFDDGHQSRSSTFISDAVRGTLGALDGGGIGEVYNIGGGEVVTLEVVDLIASLLGRTPRLAFGPARNPVTSGRPTPTSARPDATSATSPSSGRPTDWRGRCPGSSTCPRWSPPAPPDPARGGPAWRGRGPRLTVGPPEFHLSPRCQ